MPPERRVCGLLLAGGQSRRMGGGDKCLLTLGGQTLLDHVARRVAPQVGPMVLNTNSDAALFTEYRMPVVPDTVPGFAGPLAGVLTGLEWTARQAPDCSWVASFACDAPFAPVDLVARLLAVVASENADMACAVSNDRDHPVFAVWPVRLAAELRHAITVEDVRKVDAWTGRYRLARAVFPTDPVDPFFNINRPEDLDAAESLLPAV